MKTSKLTSVIAVLVVLSGFMWRSFGATLYVWSESPEPKPPYTNWTTAARVIQEAVNAASSGDEIVVTNGVYATGGRAVHGAMTNRVALPKALTLRSVNGPEFTVIEGYQVPGTRNGPGAIRCVYLADGARLSGFTLTNGATCTSGDTSRERSGGGVYCASTDAVVTNCVLAGNTAERYGGGAYRGTLYNCTLTGNSAWSGGGACWGNLYKCKLTGNSAWSGGGASGGNLYNCTLTANSSGWDAGGASGCTLYNCTLAGNSAQRAGGGASGGTLYNCTLTGNSAWEGGGANGGTLNNCTVTGNLAFRGGGIYATTANNSIVYFNTDSFGGNHCESTLNHCCTTPLPGNGVGNIDADPQLVSMDHIGASSPCRWAGDAKYATGVDIDGEPWASPPSIGCDEIQPGPLTGPLSPTIWAQTTAVGVGYAVKLVGSIKGQPTACAWDLGDGTQATNLGYVTHAWGSAGDYTVRFVAYNDNHPDGVAATVTITVVEAVHYVSLNSINPVPPYSSWATAATNIQDAVDAATVPGATVLVGNGTYSNGHRDGSRVAVKKLLILRSVEGPQETIIDGNGEMRCVYLANGAILSGFTLTNGSAENGGGVYAESFACVITNCLLTGNFAGDAGGGACGGTLYNCTLTNNSAQGVGGGACEGTLYNCALTANGAREYGGGACEGALYNCSLTGNSAVDGGGACWSTLYNCTLTGNSADYGGGDAGGKLYNCTLTGNSARDGGGAYNSTLHNCTVTGNSAQGVGGGACEGTLYNCTVTANLASQGGGLCRSTAYNSIVYFNTAIIGGNHCESTLNHCCTTPLPGNGVGNIDADPQLVSMDHIGASSPCRWAGDAKYATGVDIDGEPWASPPSIGCDEIQPGPLTAPLSPTIWTQTTAVGVGYAVKLVGSIKGQPTASAWDFGDETQATNLGYVTHAWGSAGDYTVRFVAYNDNHPDGVAATVTITVVEAVHYVSLNSINPVPPYSSWATAATNIQDAVDAATGTGATVLVSNGTFAAGECRASGDSRNRVVVAKPLIIKSVEGPETTIIDGNGKMRCVYLANGAILSGFTLTNGSAENGAGVYAESLACVVTNCIVIGNSADAGGGAFQATMYNCRLTANSANKGGGACKCRLEDCVLCENHAYACWKHYRFEWWWSLGEGGGALSCAVNNCKLVGNSADNNGGGACDSTLYNCTVTGNSGQRGGGVHGTTAYDSIVYYNMADRGENHSDSTLNYCCTTPLPFEGVGNIDADPQLVSLGHIAAGSPCRGAGNAAYAAGVDIDGEPWASPPSIGCDEVYAEVLTGPLAPTIRASFDNVAVGYPLNLEGFAEGNVTANAWEFGDGTRATNRVYVTHAWTSAGDYKLTFTVFNDSHPEGVSTNVTIRVSEAVHYVSANSANPVPPYSSWTTAATNIQDAVDLATVSGATVLVGSGTYATGQRESEDIEFGWWYISRLVVAKPLIIKSVERTETTIIDGNAKMRCVYLASGAILSGFTLTNGSAWYGGGVYAVPSGCVITNCVLTGNSAWEHGGGAHGGTLYNCTLTGNSAWEGGGAYWGTLYNCTLTGNWADSEGGGASKSTLYNCTVTGNLATGNGGGAYGGALYNCTLTGNSADSGGGLSSGSDWETGRDLPGAANNCIVYFNKGGNYAGATMNYCCTTPLPTNGVGNIDADPRFVNAAAGDFRLLPDSPCIDAGTNLINIIATDMAGLPRPLDGNGDGVARFDMGAYEFNPYRFEPTLQFDAGGFAFTVRGEPGKLVRIERSRDLVTWELAAIVPLPASGQRLVDPAATTEPFVFYRAVTP